MRKEYTPEEKEKEKNIKDHKNKDKSKAIIGDKLYINLLECRGVSLCLVRSLNASSKG